MFLDEKTFIKVVNSTPLISIDLIIRNSENQFLLGKRLNEPAKNFWFVPGGRVLKNEKIDDAFERLTKAELGKAFKKDSAVFFGFYEHFYSQSMFAENVSTHYVVLAFELKVSLEELDLPQGEQHGEYCWTTAEEILSEESVHQHTKDYFLKES